jgi:hypothetical protein
MSEPFQFSLKKLMWFTTLLAIWLGSWFYMARTIHSPAPNRQGSIWPVLICFVAACVVQAVPLVSLSRRYEKMGCELALAASLVTLVNVVLFVVAAVRLAH